MMATVKKKLAEKPMLSLEATMDYLQGKKNPLHQKIESGQASLYNNLDAEGIYALLSSENQGAGGYKDEDLDRAALSYIYKNAGIDENVLNRFVKNKPHLIDENGNPMIGFR